MAQSTARDASPGASVAPLDGCCDAPHGAPEAEELGHVDGVHHSALLLPDGGGGIVQRYPELLKSSSFRSGFENKGRYRALVEKIPTSLITHPHPGLLGAGYVARKLANGGLREGTVR